MPLTHSPDPTHLGTGAGTAAQQSARPRQVADHVNGGWDDYVAPPAPATGATAGVPGVWTPPGSAVPADIAAVRAANIVASPATAWTVGQHVVMGAGQTFWDGNSWEPGMAPVVGTTRTLPAMGDIPAYQPARPERR